MSTKTKWIKRIALTLVAIGCVTGVSLSLNPTPIPVQVSKAVRGPLVVTVDGAGRTRLVNKQTISAPVNGVLSRITLRPGDKVSEGQVVAEILPSVSAPLDARYKAETIARLGSARAGIAEAQRNVERAEVALELALKEVERNRKLVDAGAIAPRELELAESEEKTRRSELELARTNVERIRRESEVVSATLYDPNKPGRQSSQRLEVTSPTGGVVLRVHQESAGPVQPGTALLDIGDPNAVELVVDLPTQSAMKVARGAAVYIDGMGNSAQLEGTVKLVEPGAFTKITALGVEEQRVNVVVVPSGEKNLWANLGDGFAADAHIEVHKALNVQKVPVGAVFREDDGSALFYLKNGRARLARVETGKRSAAEVEVRSGLVEGTEVVVHPSDKLKEGLAVKVE